MEYLYLTKYWEINKEYNLDKLLYLMIDRPNDITDYSEIVWKKTNTNLNHRDYDLPSWIDCYRYTKICSLFWDVNHILHRKNNKPAVIYTNGCKRYYINGKFIKEENLR